MELRKLPGAWFDSRTSWLARTDARRTALLNCWNINDSSFPVRIENAALAPWLPFLGATPAPLRRSTAESRNVSSAEYGRHTRNVLSAAEPGNVGILAD